MQQSLVVFIGTRSVHCAVRTATDLQRRNSTRISSEYNKYIQIIFSILKCKINSPTNILVPSYVKCKYEGWNFNSGNYLFTTDTK